eukprot:6788166-Pyramimonas_sp.AAC.1
MSDRSEIIGHFFVSNEVIDEVILPSFGENLGRASSRAAPTRQAASFPPGCGANNVDYLDAFGHRSPDRLSDASGIT